MKFNILVIYIRTLPYFGNTTNQMQTKTTITKLLTTICRLDHDVQTWNAITEFQEQEHGLSFMN